MARGGILFRLADAQFVGHGIKGDAARVILTDVLLEGIFPLVILLPALC